jgi:hypothetical protein
MMDFKTLLLKHKALLAENQALKEENLLFCPRKIPWLKKGGLPGYQQALRITERTQGAEHPNTAVCLANIGSLYLAQKDYTHAEEYLRKAQSQMGLAHLYLATGRPMKALELLVRLKPSQKATPADRIQFFTSQGLAFDGVGRRCEGAVVLNKAVQEIEHLRRRVKGESTSFFQSGFSATMS